MESSGQGLITFETKRVEAGTHKWEARIHQRACVWPGDTEEEALANLVNGVAQLAASGSINPGSPDDPGPITGGPVQQCVELLERKLALEIAESADASKKAMEPGRPVEHTNEAHRRHQEARRVIGNIGTALAALCRIESY